MKKSIIAFVVMSVMSGSVNAADQFNPALQDWTNNQQQDAMNRILSIAGDNKNPDQQAAKDWLKTNGGSAVTGLSQRQNFTDSQIIDYNQRLNQHTSDIGHLQTAVAGLQNDTQVMQQVLFNQDKTLSEKANTVDVIKSDAELARRIAENKTSINGKVDQSIYDHDKAQQDLINQDFVYINDAHDHMIENNRKDIDGLKGTVTTHGADISQLQKDVTGKVDTTTYTSDLSKQAQTDHTQDGRILALENQPKPKDGKDGINGLDGAAGRDGTNGADGKDGHNGTDGRNGVDGKNGVTTTVITTDNTKLMQETEQRQKDVAILAGQSADHETRITKNEYNIKSNRDAINKETSQRQRDIVDLRGEMDINMQSMGSQLRSASKANTRRIDKVEQDVKDVKTSIKHIAAGGLAAANLHYNRAESGYAVAVGQYKDATAIAGGLQFNTSVNTAATVQVSYDGESAGASVGFHGSW